MEVSVGSMGQSPRKVKKVNYRFQTTSVYLYFSHTVTLFVSFRCFVVSIRMSSIITNQNKINIADIAVIILEHARYLLKFSLDVSLC